MHGMTAQTARHPSKTLKEAIRQVGGQRRGPLSAVNRNGRIDTLINNAGGQRPYPASQLPLEHFEKVIRNNLVGTFSMTQAVAREASTTAPSVRSPVVP